MRRTFAVGRLTPESAEIVLLADEEEEDARRAPVPGPWSLRAVVRDLRPPGADGTDRTVH